ncbi:MAG: FlgD immunoglobulin-like domain containing protein [candidate division KSB1 bacterium]|nr:FlgD immunoglobulin-like domain containing protein [candidate division KSB1 bacterium]MDQ7063094.1 FlgD immunoglobulin-like domain containing protein [candidate division KSB1 bacterium]
MRVRILLVSILLPMSLSAQSFQTRYFTTLQRFEQALAGIDQRPVKCGLSAAMAFREHAADLPAEQRLRIQGVMQRPSLAYSYVSEKGHFKIHYDTEGPHAVDPTSTNPDGVPDFVYEAARAAERSYFLLVDSLGFRPHIPDDGEDGPEYDIYILHLGNVYGWTFSEKLVSQNPVRYSSYMQVDNNFIGGYFSKGLDGLRVTIAHEYFHAIQFAYAYKNEDLFFFEMSSVWFEDVAFDAVNDYLQYLPGFFRELDRPLHLRNDWHEYGAGLWLKYWLQDRDYRSLRRMWEGLETRAALEAMKQEVEQQGVLFPEAIAEFYSWCLFTGPRAVPGRYFEEAALYPTISISPQRFIEMAGDTIVVDSLRALSARFFQVNVDPTKNFSAILSSQNPGAWRIIGASETLSGELNNAILRQGPAPLLLKAVENEGKIFVAVVNGGLPEDLQRTAEFLPHEPYELNLSLRVFGDFSEGLLAPRPNPFILRDNSSLSILYSLDESADVELVILDELGMPVFRRQIGFKPEGLNQFVWDGRNDKGNSVASGVYIVLLQTSSGVRSAKKVAIIRP